MDNCKEIANSMPGWNNQLQLGKAGGASLGGGGKKVQPVASFPGGLGSRSVGPEATRMYRSVELPGVGDFEARHTSRSHLQARYSVLCFPTRQPNFHIAPSLSSRDILVAMISSDKGNDIPPAPPPVDLCRKCDGWKESLGWCLVS